MENSGVGTGSQARADKLEERLIDFAVRIVILSANLPKTPAGGNILLDRSCDQELPPRRIMVKQEVQKAMLISFTNSVSFLKS
jgi:hypothetical protein